MPHLSTRISDAEARQLDVIARKRGVPVKGARSKIVRELIAEEHARVSKKEGPPPVAGFDELERMLTNQARTGSVAAMKELRGLLERKERVAREAAEKKDAENAAAQPAPGADGDSNVTALDAIRRRSKR